MQLELCNFNISAATHIVSLGDACGTAYNLRRHFDFGGAFPFDWWISADVDGMVRFLGAPDVEVLYNPSRLESTPNAGSVRHRDFGFWLHHEFPRRWSVPNTPIQEDWREHRERPKERTRALLAKLFGLNSSENRIAFVREGNTSPTLSERLGALFPLAVWTLIPLTGLKNHSFGWKGDPVVWDEALSALGLTLDRNSHRPYVQSDSIWNL